MREQLIQYVELLFAGAPNTTEIKQEILQNTLDRYDDLVSQGKTPEAAYRLAISGIGDINEIIGGEPQPQYSAPTYHEEVREAVHDEAQDIQKKKMRAVAVAMYILCPVPLFILGDIGSGVMGLCFMFLLIAAATALMIMSGSGSKKEEEPAYVTPKQQMRNSIAKVVNAIVLVVYLAVSFSTGAWYITWIIFPIAGSVKGLIFAIMDLKEASDYEN